MTPFGHVAAGYLVFKQVSKSLNTTGLNRLQQLGLLWLGLVMAVIPDLDVLWLGLQTHRASLLHYPLFWLVMVGGIFLFGWLVNSQLVKLVSLVVLVGTWLHLGLDTLNPMVRVKLLWPLTEVMYSMKPVSEYLGWSGWDYRVFLSLFVIDELLVGVVAGLVYLRERGVEVKAWLPKWVRY